MLSNSIVSELEGITTQKEREKRSNISGILHDIAAMKKTLHIPVVKIVNGCFDVWRNVKAANSIYIYIYWGPA